MAATADGIGSKAYMVLSKCVPACGTCSGSQALPFFRGAQDREKRFEMEEHRERLFPSPLLLCVLCHFWGLNCHFLASVAENAAIQARSVLE